MATINPTTPQLKLVKGWVDAHLALDIDKISAVLSKDYKHQRLPKTTGHLEETREEFVKRLAGSMAAFTEFNVCVQCSMVSFELLDRRLPPSPRSTR